jgi:hypothetical protein
MVVTLRRPPSADDLLQASLDLGRLLVAAVQAAPVVSDYFAQVAAHLLEADQALFSGKYAEAIQFGFGGKGILSLPSVGASTATPGPALAAAAGLAATDASLPTAAFAGADFGFDRPVVMRVPAQPRRLAASAVAPDGGSLPPAPAEDVAAGFLRELLLRRKVRLPHQPHDADLVDPGPLKTHRLVDEGDHLRVERLLVE